MIFLRSYFCKYKIFYHCYLKLLLTPATQIFEIFYTVCLNKLFFSAISPSNCSNKKELGRSGKKIGSWFQITGSKTKQLILITRILLQGLKNCVHTCVHISCMQKIFDVHKKICTQIISQLKLYSFKTYCESAYHTSG